MAAILDNFEWPYLRNASRSRPTYIARTAFLLQDVFDERDNDCCNMEDLQLSVEDSENRAEWRRTRVADPLPERSTA